MQRYSTYETALMELIDAVKPNASNINLTELNGNKFTEDMPHHFFIYAKFDYIDCKCKSI